MQYRHWLAILLSIVGFAFAAGSAARAGGWDLVFSDEFNGTSLDRTKWATRYIYENETLGHFNDEKQRYLDKQNHVIADGVLSLVARKGQNDLYESGMIRSHRTFYYGYYEARVFLPSARGVWPAFWLVGDYDLDGRTWHPPELDIFEYAQNGVEDRDNMIHSGAIEKPEADPSVFTFVAPGFDLRWNNLHADQPLNAAWHTAGYVWAPDRISFFLDGRHIYTRKYKWLKADGSLGPPAELILNFAVGGIGWAGRHGIDEAAFPQSFKIDYVRVCQYTPGARGTRQCGASTVTPDPEQFGYASAVNDMAKPTFLPIDSAIGRSIPSGGTATLPPDTGLLDVTVPFRLPEGYPDNRSVRIWVVDSTSGKTVASSERKLPEIARRPDGVRAVTVALPRLTHPGEYRVEAEMKVADTVRKEVRPAPIACATDLPQPEKARSCQLLSLRVETE